MGNECESTHADDLSLCVHHWLIDVHSLGVCKKCGESKQFNNSWSAKSLQRSWSNRSGGSRSKTVRPPG